jgi:hypothetical protein
MFVLRRNDVPNVCAVRHRGGDWTIFDDDPEGDMTHVEASPVERLSGEIRISSRILCRAVFKGPSESSSPLQKLTTRSEILLTASR